MKKTKTKVYSSIGVLFHGGKMIDYNTPIKMTTMNFQHLYYTNGFMPGSSKRHACLKRGHWCWKNLWEYPLDLFAYLQKNNLI